MTVQLADSPTDPLPAFIAGNEFERPGWFTQWAHETLPAEYLRDVTGITLKDELASDAEIAELVAKLQPGSRVSFEGKVGEETMRVLADADRLEGVYFNSGSTVSADALQQLSRMQNLKSLEIYEVKIELDGLKHLPELKGLETLFLKCSKIDDASLSFLSGLSSLTWFEFESSNLKGHGLRHLAGIKSMERMELNELPLEDADVEFLATMPRLKYLQLEGTNVTDVALSYLAQATGLRSLDLASTQVKGAGLEYLKNCKKLWSLSLTTLTLENTPALNQLEGLEHLGLSNTLIDDEDVVGIVLPNLECVTVSNTGITEKGLRAPAGKNPRLKRISTTGLKVSKEEFQRLSAWMPRVNFDY